MDLEMAWNRQKKKYDLKFWYHMKKCRISKQKSPNLLKGMVANFLMFVGLILIKH